MGTRNDATSAAGLGVAAATKKAAGAALSNEAA